MTLPLRPEADDNMALDLVYDKLLEHGSEWAGEDSQDWTCPAHDDKSPSLGVMAGDTQPVLLKCQAGCKYDDILTALGLTPADVAPKMYLSTTYKYHDEDGVLLYEVERWEDGFGAKDFRQFAIERNGQRRRGKNPMKNVRRVLWKLPQVVGWAAAGKVILVCEGEKGATKARVNKLCATTNSGGSKQPWLDSYTESLRGASEVVIVADRDKPGYEHAAEVYDALKLAGVPCRVVLSKTTGHKHDLVDHFEAGFKFRDLVPIARTDLVWKDDGATPGQRSYKIVWANEIKIRKVKWLWDQWIPAGALTLIAGSEGVGKSTWAYQHLADLTRGLVDGEFKGTPRNVLVVATEDDWSSTINPRLMAAGADMNRVAQMVVTSASGLETSLDLSVDLHELRQVILDTEAVATLFDPLMSRLGDNVDSHKDKDVRKDLEPLVKMAMDSETALLGIIHLNKSGQASPLNRVMGSKAFTAVARSVLFFLNDPDDHTTVLLGHAKSNLGRKYEGLKSFTIMDDFVLDEDGDPVPISKLEWGEDDPRHLEAVAAASATSSENRTVATEAAMWLVEYMRTGGDVGGDGKTWSADVMKAATDMGFAKSAVHRGRKLLGDAIVIEQTRELGSKTMWSLDESRLTKRFRVVFAPPVSRDYGRANM